jgi:hypothetical protein
VCLFSYLHYQVYFHLVFAYSHVGFGVVVAISWFVLFWVMFVGCGNCDEVSEGKDVLRGCGGASMRGWV